MTNKMILHGIQIFLLLLMVIVFRMIFSYARREKINLRERFFTGFWIGYIADLLDTLGIGTFATTTTLFKVTKLVEDDRKIPATMTTAHIIPVLVEALLFITIVKVDFLTLITMGTAAYSGAYIGARFTQHWNTKMVQRILGMLLIIAAGFMIFRMLTNPGADLTDQVRGLVGGKLLLGILFDFIIGMLMSMGLGNYAPELIFFSLMGISPAVALPVMMLNAAMIMTAGSKQFIESGRVSWKGVAGMMTGGVCGVLTAAMFLTKLDINKLKILVVCIAIYTGCMLIRSSLVQTIQKNK